MVFSFNRKQRWGGMGWDRVGEKLCNSLFFLDDRLRGRSPLLGKQCKNCVVVAVFDRFLYCLFYQFVQRCGLLNGKKKEPLIFLSMLLFFIIWCNIFLYSRKKSNCWKPFLFHDTMENSRCSGIPESHKHKQEEESCRPYEWRARPRDLVSSTAMYRCW